MLRAGCIASLIVWLVVGTPAVADDQPQDLGPFARGFGYVGAFWVTRASDELMLFSNDLPLGTRISLQRDLGIEDSYAVPRMTLGWRFGRRHVLTGGFYDLSRSAAQRAARTIPLPDDNEIEVGVEVKTDFTFRVAKLQYTYLFHRDEKVTLGLGAGAFVANLGARLSATAFVGPIQQPEEPLDEAFEAPVLEKREKAMRANDATAEESDATPTDPTPLGGVDAEESDTAPTDPTPLGGVDAEPPSDESVPGEEMPEDEEPLGEMPE